MQLLNRISAETGPFKKHDRRTLPLNSYLNSSTREVHNTKARGILSYFPPKSPRCYSQLPWCDGYHSYLKRPSAVASGRQARSRCEWGEAARKGGRRPHRVGSIGAILPGCRWPEIRPPAQSEDLNLAVPLRHSHPYSFFFPLRPQIGDR
jgi:hypothetical protein